MEPDKEGTLRDLLATILDVYHYDFRDYSHASLQRRVSSALASMHLGSIEELRARVAVEPRSFSDLLDFLTVPVSDMFRDPPYFSALRERVVPVLRTYPSLKVWVAGCSNGEEVYSLAILLHEAGLLERALIYATDINPRSLARAEAGIYSLERVRRFSESYLRAGGSASLSRYYQAVHGAALFDRTLKKRLVFSDHSLATDNVFAEVQLISCRNVLIYFDRALQDRALGLFADALCRRGFLGLGSRESVRLSSQSDRFEEIHGEARLYQRSD